MSLSRWIVIAIVLAFVGGCARGCANEASRRFDSWWLHRSTHYVGSPSDFE